MDAIDTTLTELRAEMRGGFADVRAEIGGLRTEMRDELGALRADFAAFQGRMATIGFTLVGVLITSMVALIIATLA